MPRSNRVWIIDDDRSIRWVLDIIPADNVLFASEMIGAVHGIDPESGHCYDDTKRYIDANTRLTDEDRQKIFAGNAFKVFSRLKRRVIT